MKRYGDIYEKIVSYENLIAAAYNASKGKKHRGNVIQFSSMIIDNVIALRNELIEKRYKPGSYKEFYVYDSKKRKISAAPYRDRVVHHAVCNVIMPIFEKTFIDNSFANRKGKGTHRAASMCRKYLHEYRYYLKCDIVKYFPSVDHEILKAILAKKIKCRDTLGLIELIIDGSNKQDCAEFYFQGDDLFSPCSRRKGIPIGNLTSQYFANIYLTPLDHYIYEKLKIRAYIRYVDDFILFHDDKKYLHYCKNEIISFLEKYRLKIHENNAHPNPADHGVVFLGYMLFMDGILLKRMNIVRFTRRMKRYAILVKKGEGDFKNIRQSVMSWLGYAKFADSYMIRRIILGKLVLK